MTNSVSCGLDGEEREVERVEVGEVRRLGEHALREREQQHGDRDREVEDLLDAERGGDRRVARVRDRRLDEEELDDVAAARGDDVVEAVGGDVRAPDQAVGDPLVGVGGAQRVVQRLRAQREVADERDHPEQQRDQADRREAVEEASDRVEEVPRAVKDRGERHAAEGIRRPTRPSRRPRVSCPAHEHRDRNTGDAGRRAPRPARARASSAARSCSRPSGWAARSSPSTATRARPRCRSPTARPSST